MAKRDRSMSTASPRRGLVLGAGGALGAAWMLGALSALGEADQLDPAACEVIVGTSAGSVLGAMFASGLSVGDLVEQVVTPQPPTVYGTGAVNTLDVHASLERLPRPVPLPANLALATRAALRPGKYPLMTMIAGLAPRGRGNLGPVADLITSAHDNLPWPETPRLRIAAMDLDTGDRVVFGHSDDLVSMQLAVTASCAAPGFFPPVTIGGRRYVDGGAVSMTNADIVSGMGLDEVVVLAPMAGLARRPRWSPAEQADRQLRRHVTRALNAEIRLLTAEAIRVHVFAPSQNDLVAMSYNVMNPARRRDVLRTAQRTISGQLTDRSDRNSSDTHSA